MKTWLHSFIGVVVGAAVATIAVSSAATPTVTYYACLKSGLLSKVSTKATVCPKGYTRISWTSQGAAGAQGPIGLTGPQGPAGAKGADGAAGSKPYVLADNGNQYFVTEVSGGLPFKVTRQGVEYQIFANTLVATSGTVELVDEASEFAGSINGSPVKNYATANCTGPFLIYAANGDWDVNQNTEIPATKPGGLSNLASQYSNGSVFAVGPKLYATRGLLKYDKALSAYGPGAKVMDPANPGTMAEFLASPDPNPTCAAIPSTLTGWNSLWDQRYDAITATTLKEQSASAWTYRTTHDYWLALEDVTAQSIAISNINIHY